MAVDPWHPTHILNAEKSDTSVATQPGTVVVRKKLPLPHHNGDPLLTDELVETKNWCHTTYSSH
jgi:hypothetical protein